MSGEPVSLEIKSEAVMASLSRLYETGADMTQVHEDIAAGLLSRVQLTMKNGVSPYGVPYKPLKYRKGGRPLIDSGDLKDSINWQADKNRAVVSTKKEYATTHQFGAVDRVITARNAKALRFFIPGHFRYVPVINTRAVRWKAVDAPIFAKSVKVTIPARPFFPAGDLPDTWRDDVLAIIHNHLAGAANG
ncbi:phage virion morphogenesis protein [candidate division KSB1 bacterium]|nr:phage virion morphogenesis protein [candidate division KSB1 bacterium]